MSKTSQDKNRHAETSAFACDETDDASKNVGRLRYDIGKSEKLCVSQDDVVNSTKTLALKGTPTEGDDIDEETLISEVLYEVINPIGFSTRVDIETLSSYLQQVFHFGPEKFHTILKKVLRKQKPKFRLHIEVLEAKGLAPKDSDGLSDPFCELHVSSSPKDIHSTSLIKKTLNPIWNECFKVNVDNPYTDVLYFDVWDYDAPETTLNAVSKIMEAKGIKGFGRALKEIANNTLSHDVKKELIGKAWIPIKDISSKGEAKTIRLAERSGGNSHGDLSIKASFMSSKNRKTALKEYKQLIRTFAFYEIQLIEEEVEWEGEFPPAAESVLQQHLAHGGIDKEDDALTKWSVYSDLCSIHNISCVLFQDILKQLAPCLTENCLSQAQIQSFWESAEIIINSSFRKLSEIRKIPPPKDNFNTLLSNTLSFLLYLSVQLSLHKKKPINDPLSSIQESVTEASLVWYNKITEDNKPVDNSLKSRINQQTNIVKLLTEDLERANQFHNDAFIALVGFPYATTLCRIYDEKVKVNVEQLVKEASTSLIYPTKKKSNGNGDNKRHGNDEVSFDIGNSLFSLFLALKSFTNIQASISNSKTSQPQTCKFHSWFLDSAIFWLDMAAYKAVIIVEKSLSLDDLQKPIHSYVKHSSSATDTVSLYVEVKKIWDQLEWPDVQESYLFMSRIVNDLCKSSLNYAEGLVKKLDGMVQKQAARESKFHVTDSWCLAINNIDYVQQHLCPLIKSLGVDKVIDKLIQIKNPKDVDINRESLYGNVNDATNSVSENTLHLLKEMAKRMYPTLKILLTAVAEKQDNASWDMMMEYLEENLEKLNSDISSDHFNKFLSIMVGQLTILMNDLYQMGIEEKKTEKYFKHLHKKLLEIKIYFTGDSPEKLASFSKVMEKLERELMLNGLDTTSLIMQVHKFQMARQRALDKPINGQLTVRARIVQQILHIDIMNARSLTAMDSNGFSDPYVTISLLPEDVFVNMKRKRTKTHKKTLFPLFDEFFQIPLTNEQLQFNDGMLLFTVEDEDMKGIVKSDFMGEGYIMLSEVVRTSDPNSPEAKQSHLNLTKPDYSGCEAMKILRKRQGDEKAKRFVKRQKSKDESRLS